MLVAFPREPAAIRRPLKTKAAAPSPTAADIPVSVKVGKTSTAYRAHSYHTKVPPDAITPFIRAYTNPGDIVADPFCGSGMTGVAALQEGRSAYLSDISPAAVHIARNYATYCDPKEFKRAYDKVAAHVSATMAWLYRPMSDDRRNIEYTTWSDLFSCPKCKKDILYWDFRNAGEAREIACGNCGEKARKSDLIWKGEIPVETHVASGKNRIESRSTNAADIALMDEVGSAPIPYWTPTAEFGPDREMWRASHSAMGITDAAHFFTRRNLHALAALRHAIFECSSGRAREALMFAFTASVNRASRRYQWNAKRPTNVMTGTLYISSLRYEWNVWSLFRRKAADVLKYYQSFAKTDASVEVFQRSATDLSCLEDGAVDMVFMDPPFGSNIFYADSSLLWEAWLGALTARASEMVVSTDRKRVAEAKDLSEYADLMRQSFGEVARVVRKGGRGVLAFSNSNDAVWEAIQDSLSDAGLGVSAVHLLDKGQPSIKGVKGLLGKENVTRLDLVLCLEKTRTSANAQRAAASSEFIEAEIAEVLRIGGGATDAVYSSVLRSALAAGLSARGITMQAIAARCLEMGATQVDGIWRREPPAIANAGDFVAGYLTSPAALPFTKDGKDAKRSPKELRPVQGGRNSPAYLAHSYHTKVPPEAIAPYIENFSRPGDVVLDPFCGSGMTGVAASALGRRSILNDLSPAAAHLAWNHTHPCDPKQLALRFNALETRVSKELDRLYSTVDDKGKAALIHWTLWSTIHRCPACAFEFSLWDVMDRESGRLGRSMTCPKCDESADRRRFTVVDSRPAWIAFERKDGSRGERAATSRDIKRACSFERSQIPTWFPDVPLGADREMYQRCALHLQSIESVADLYTPRNLRALSLIWSEILAEPDERLKRALAFAFTNTAWHGTRMRRFNARGGQRPLTGTLYVPQLSSEANVLEVMRNKIKQLCKFYSTLNASGVEPAVVLGSATNLQGVRDGSVDYIFTDPPFGSNIFYADCNLIWESWLGRVTDPTLEAVVNRSLPQARGGKSLDDYKALMTDAMQEMARALKPGGWATVVFHNTDAAVWAAIQAAAASAGFEFHEATSLDRKQQSHKGYKGREGHEDVAHFDVVMSLKKPAQVSRQTILPLARGAAAEASIEDEVEGLLRIPEIAKRGVQGVHAEIMRRRASSDSATFVNYGDVRAAVDRVVGRPARKRRAG
ncbi:MAG TPA: DNA methyltransferase [Caulobacterales bacterium]|nr:DNA methyltransferase [Caulobacterales bacterium]